MTEHSPEQVGENWDKVGRKYGEFFGPRFAPYAKDALRIVPAGAGKRVVDVATGPGTLALAAARGGARVVATDFSPVMVEQVQARARAEGLEASVEARVMDGQALDLPEGAFDAGYSMFGLMVFPSRAAGFSELHRVLKGGGRALVACWDRPPRNAWLAVFRQALGRALPDAPEPSPPPFMELADPERLAGEMEAAGFEDVEVARVDHTLDFGPPERLWEAFMETNPAMPGMLAQLGGEGGRALKEALTQVGRERVAAGGGATVRLPTGALLGSGTKPA